MMISRVAQDNWKVRDKTQKLASSELERKQHLTIKNRKKKDFLIRTEKNNNNTRRFTWDMMAMKRYWSQSES